MDARGVAQTDFVESLSIPIQLTARVYADGEAVENIAKGFLYEYR